MREVDTRTGKCISPPRSELNRPCVVQSLAYWISLSLSPPKVTRVSLTALLASLEGIALIATSLSLVMLMVTSLLRRRDHFLINVITSLNLRR